MLHVLTSSNYLAFYLYHRTYEVQYAATATNMCTEKESYARAQDALVGAQVLDDLVVVLDTGGGAARAASGETRRGRLTETLRGTIQRRRKLMRKQEWKKFYECSEWNA